MLTLAILSIILSAAASYAVGYAIIAPRDVFLRSKTGIWLLVMLALSFIPLPPQLTALDSTTPSLSSVAPGMNLSVTWPAALGKGPYLTLWVIASLLALLAGLRIWNAGKPGWRASSATAAYDTSKTGRVRAMLVMADTLEDSLDLLKRMEIDAKSAEQLAEELHRAGERFSNGLPESAGDVYRMVATIVPPATASVVTRLLLEGAGRRAPSTR
ncbi:MAG: hypothetical protein Q7V14_04540 [Coriobacteriia bacterium]|nr:hypothetical protein [Coriobacteriia bacterium]